MQSLNSEELASKVHDFYLLHYGQEPIQSVRALGWGSERSQSDRFKILIQIGIQPTDAILDVGCGHGDLFAFLGQPAGYYGIDLREAPVLLARERYPTGRFDSCSIDGVADHFDWVVASGIFSFEMDYWHAWVAKTVQAMYAKSTKGVAVNFLSTHHSHTRLPGVKYCSIPEIVSHVIVPVTNKFTLRHDYRDNDFTVYLYHDCPIS